MNQLLSNYDPVSESTPATSQTSATNSNSSCPGIHKTVKKSCEISYNFLYYNINIHITRNKI